MEPDTLVAVEARIKNEYPWTETFCLPCAEKRGLQEDPYDGTVDFLTFQNMEDAYMDAVYADPREHYVATYNPKEADHQVFCSDCGTVVYEAWFREFDWDFEGPPKEWEYR